jgi:hypothetical protein
MKYFFSLFFIWLIVSTCFGQSQINLVPYKTNQKWGFADENGKVQISAKYDHVSFFNENYAKVEINNKFGYINISEELVLSIKYDDCNRINLQVFEVKENEKFGLINDKGVVLLPTSYDSIKEVSHLHRRDYNGEFLDMLVYKNGKVGLIQLKNNMVLNLFDTEYLSIWFIQSVRQFRCRLSKEIIRTYNESGEFLKEFKNNRIDPTQGGNPMIHGMISGAQFDSRSTRCTENIDTSYIIRKNTLTAADENIRISDPKKTMTVKNVWKTKETDEYESTIEIEYDVIENGPRIINLTLFKCCYLIFNNGKCGLLGSQFKLESNISASALLIPIEYTSITKYGNGDYLMVGKEGSYGIMAERNFQLITQLKYKYIEREWFYNFYNTGISLFKVTDFNDRTYFVNARGFEFIDL